MLKLEKTHEMQSPIMEPIEPMTLFKHDAMQPDVIGDADFKSIPFLSTPSNEDESNGRSFLLMDANENMLLATTEMFCKKLKSSDNEKIKVVSIFGNTGDGKSHTMNNTFFCGERVFPTSNEQNSCTIGVYAAMQHELGVLCLDTEGLLGTTTNSNQTMRMLLKVLAISDIVIYRTRSERLHSDMYDFLGTASKAFCKHFSQALQSLAIPGTAKTLGPAVIVFHETRHTKPLENSVEESAEDKLRENFARLNYDINAFSSLRYVGIQTENNSLTDYTKFLNAVRLEIENTAVRSPRQPSVVFKALKALNMKFSGKINDKPVNPFPEQYFTCPVHCESCSRRCQRSMGHENESHMNANPCNYQQQFENKVYLCKTCYTNGKEIIVRERMQTQNESSWYGLAKYAWTGAVIDCPQCGEIFRARKYWYGNESPEDKAVRPQIVHVWKDSNKLVKTNGHSAQMVVDSVSYLTETITSISSQPTKAISDWLADKVAPSYWKPNNEILNCFACKKNFEKTGLPKHHCRGCGEGFCHACSQHKMPVPARGWNDAVRVCNDCKQNLKAQGTFKQENENTTEENNHTNSNHNTGRRRQADDADILVRKYGETLYNTISCVATAALQYPKEIIKDNARPAYWVPDADSPGCFICKMLFGDAETLALHAYTTGSSATQPIKGDNKRHHCRRCGQAVCANCSKTRQPVPERGWPTEVRVCDSCVREESETNNLLNNRIKNQNALTDTYDMRTHSSVDDNDLKTKIE